LRPVQTRYKELTEDPKHLDTLLSEAADRVRPTANRVLAKVKERVGIG